MSETRLALDNLPARVAGPWTKDKLYYVERYARAFMTAMNPKRAQGLWNRLIYLDLLAGSGLCIDRETYQEFPGSALRAIDITPTFDQFFFSDNDNDNISALKQRIEQAKPGIANVYCECGDCNRLAFEFMPKISGRDLGLAFLDPEGFEVKFDTFRALSGRRIDVIFLFPSGGTRRNIGNWIDQHENLIDELVGGNAWRELFRQGKPRLLTILDYFKGNMSGLGYVHADSYEPPISNRRNVNMYHLLFFSKDKIGLDIWKNTKQIDASGQRPLF